MKKIMLTTVFIVIICTRTFSAGAREESYYPTSQVQENEWRDISEEDIQKAFDAEPQLAFPLRIAWYNMGNDALIRNIAITNHEVASNYYLPKTLIEGFTSANQDTHQVYLRPVTLNLKAIRLASARAKCDVLILAGSSLELRNGANALSIFNLLLIPLLFNPAFKLTADYSTEMYVLDVRNEYLYGQFTYNADTVKKNFLTLKTRNELVESIQKEELNKAAGFLSDKLNELFMKYIEK